MNHIDKSERATQNRIVQFFQDGLNYQYLGEDWNDKKNITVTPPSQNPSHAFLFFSSFVNSNSIGDEQRHN